MNPLTPGWRSTAFWTTNLAIIAAFLASGTPFFPRQYGVYCAAISAALYALSRGIKKLSDLQVAKGWKTSEFAVCVLAVACAVLSAIAGVLPPEAAALCGTIITGAFSLSQGLAQLGTQSTDSGSAASIPESVDTGAVAVAVAAQRFAALPDDDGTPSE